MDAEVPRCNSQWFVLVTSPEVLVATLISWAATLMLVMCIVARVFEMVGGINDVVFAMFE